MGFGLTKNRQKASEWNNFISINYRQITEQGIMASGLFDDTTVPTNLTGIPTTNVKFIKGYTIDAIEKVQQGTKPLLVLNFASYFQAGGGYIKGCMAQEESLCHASNLWQILSSNKIQQAFYEVNKQAYMYNNYLFRNRAIYSPVVVFPKQNKTCGVITCAAPDLRKSLAETRNSDPEAINAVKDRIRFVMSLAQRINPQTFILGAFGCGVFKNDPVLVAKTFAYYIKQMYFNEIIFAIPSGENYDVFYNVFREENLIKNS